jgi:hypothetical protein
MSKRALKNQDRAQKMCACGRSTVYTDNAPGQPRLDGKPVCEECYVEHLYSRYFNNKEN